MKSGGSAGSGSAAPSTASASLTVEVTASMAEKHPDTDENANLRKRSKMVTSEQVAGVVGSTTKAPAEKGKEPAMKGKKLIGKGKEPAEVEEVPKWGYTIRDLCELEDKAAVNGYFASIMTRQSLGEGEELLMLRWSSVLG
ncbi:hypothetical protein GW17_00051366 [Ensete ventricosum]|nr:hypothetical protein GW17_00051366 [Ensete ventricosum]